ncbi:MAG: hypothetical protein MMC23_005128 [Stictis urceolatum]|nr:hypothetical protein [Stictis urceolata]
MHGKNEPEETNIFCNFDRLRPATSAEAAQFDAALRPNLWFDQVQNAFFVIHGDLADCKNRPVTDLVTFSGKEAVTLWFPTGTRTTVMSICSWYVTKNIKQGAKVTISDSGDLVTYARGSRNVGNKFKNLLKERQAVDTTMLFDGTILHELTQSFGTKGSNERPTNDGGSYGWSNIRKASGNIAVGSTNADSLAFYALGVYLRNNSVKWAKADR